jgi:hypothetical protein
LRRRREDRGESFDEKLEKRGGEEREQTPCLAAAFRRLSILARGRQMGLVESALPNRCMEGLQQLAEVEGTEHEMAALV